MVKAAGWLVALALLGAVIGLLVQANGRRATVSTAPTPISAPVLAAQTATAVSHSPSSPVASPPSTVPPDRPYTPPPGQTVTPQRPAVTGPLEVESFTCTWDTFGGSSGFAYVKGEVRNVSSQPLRDVEAVGSWYTSDGEFIRADDALIDFNPVLPGQASPFKTISTYNPAMSRCQLQFKSLLGAPIAATFLSENTSSSTAPDCTPAASAQPMSQTQMKQISLSAADLPAGFAITASGPGGPQLGQDVLSSYQEEFQQRDVASSQDLQQTIVVIDLIGQYKNAACALAGISTINEQNLNQLLGSLNVASKTIAIPPVGQDSEGFHFTGTTNGVAIGGYLIAFHEGSMAALVLTAGVQGAESLDRTVALAEAQAAKLAASAASS